MSAASIFEINADLSDENNLGQTFYGGAKTFYAPSSGGLSSLNSTQLVIIGSVLVAAIFVYKKVK